MTKATWMIMCGAVGLSLTVAGCGPPVLSQMKPTVAKTTVWVGVVDQPSGWDANSLEQSLLASGIIPQVKDVTAARLGQTLTSAVKTIPASLYVVVAKGDLNSQVTSLVSAYPGKHFEIVTSEPQVVPAKVRLEANSGLASGYALGYLAALIASDRHDLMVGLLTDGTAQCSQAAIQAALLGVYNANAQLNIQPVTLSGQSVQPDTAHGGISGTANTSATGTGTTSGTSSQVGNVGGNGNANTGARGATGAAGSGSPSAGATSGGTGVSGGSVAGTGVAGSGGLTAAVAVPHIILATRPLSAAEWQTVKQAGCLVVSLVADPAYHGALLVGQPELPAPENLVADANGLANGQWTPGVHTIQTSPAISFASGALSAPSVAAFESMLQGATPASLHLTSVWHSLPAPIQTIWSQWAKLGTRVEPLLS